MKRLFTSILIFLGTHTTYSQVAPVLKNTIGISIPVIWNNSNGIYYSLGNRKEPSGNSISYGINVSYTKSIDKSWFLFIGVGSFRQSFKITRPFYFDGDTISKLLYSTKEYYYDCLKLEGGLGYNYKISNSLSVNSLISYNQLKSSKQEYIPTGLSGYQHSSTQKNASNFQIGYMVNLSFGVEKNLYKNISMSADIFIPVVTKWKDDTVFINYPFANDSQQIAENKFSLGTVIGCKYHF